MCAFRRRRRASRRRQQRPSARRPAAPRGTRCCVERPGGRHALLRAMGAGARSGRAPARTAREKLRAMEAMLTPACPRKSPEGAARGPERLGPFTASTAVAPSASAAERALSPKSQRRCGARGRLCALRVTETSGGASRRPSKASDRFLCRRRARPPRAIAQLQPGAACSPSAASPIADFPSGQGVGEGDARGVSVRRSRLAKNSPILTESPGIIHDRARLNSWDRRRFACAPQNQKPRTAAGARTTVAAPSPRVSVVSPSTQIQRKSGSTQ